MVAFSFSFGVMRGLLITVIVCCSLMQRVTMLESRLAQQDVCTDSESGRLGSEVLCLQDVHQVFVEYFDICGFDGSLEEEIGHCSIHENGLLCGQFNRDERRQVEEIEDECFRNGGFNPVNGTCTNACQVEILDFRAALGCCANSFYNYTGSKYVNETSYELWSTCGVTTLDFCDTNVTFTPPSEPPTECELYAITCSEEFRHLFFDPGEDCTESVASLEICGIDENGEFCQFRSRFGSDDRLAEAVDGNCTTYGQICPIECRRALNEFRDGLGCCLNNLYSFDDEYNHTVRSELWSWCGVDLPDFCNTTFTINTEQSTPTTESDSDGDTVTFVLVAVIVILVLLLVVALVLTLYLIWRNRKYGPVWSVPKPHPDGINGREQRYESQTRQRESPQVNTPADNSTNDPLYESLSSDGGEPNYQSLRPQPVVAAMERDRKLQNHDQPASVSVTNGGPRYEPQITQQEPPEDATTYEIVHGKSLSDDGDPFQPPQMGRFDGRQSYSQSYYGDPTESIKQLEYVIMRPPIEDPTMDREIIVVNPAGVDQSNV